METICVWITSIEPICMEIPICLSCVGKILLEMLLVGIIRVLWFIRVLIELVLDWKEISGENSQNWPISVFSRHPYA